MSRVDASDPEIKAAIDELKSGGTNWIMLGYVPKSDSKLRLADKGTGGFKELAAEFNDGKVLFALCAFEINNNKKFVYIPWCGEGVIGMKKGLFNNHSQDVQFLFKGFHVQINARNEDDLDESKILAKLKTSTGASYDSGAKNQGASTLVPTNVAQGRQQATQSNAKGRSADKSDYNKKNESDEFWVRQREEEERQKAEAASNKSDKKADYAKSAERDKFWAEQNQQQQQQSSSTTTQRAPVTGSSGGASALRNRFENPPPQQPPQRQAAAAAPSRPGPPPAANKPAPPAPAAKPAPAPPAPEPEPEPEPEQTYEEQPQEWQQEEQTYQQDDQSYQQDDQSYQQQDDQSYQQSEEQPQEEQQQEWQQEEQTYQQDDQSQYQQQEEYQQDTNQEQSYADQGYGDQGYDQGATGGVGQAKALYDYDAENEGDLSFKEGDVITVVDKSDPSGWWEGEVNGLRGFFPSNFVQEI